VNNQTRTMLFCLSLAVIAALMAALGAGCAAPAPTVAPPKPAASAAVPAAATATAPAAPAAVATAPAAAAPPPTAATAVKVKRGGTLRDVQRLAIDILDPHLASTRNAQFMPLLFDNLLSYKLVDPKTEKFELGPGLAESYKVIDPTTMEFKLRPGVKYHDGTALDAASVKWNLERANTNPKSKVKETVRDIKEIQVVDPTTLRLLLKTPSAVLPLQLTSSNPVMVVMVSKDAVDKLGEDKFATAPVGSGPLKLKDWVRDDRVTLEKFAGHWEKGEDGQPLPYYDGFVSRLITDQSVALVETRTGNIDTFLNIELKDVATVRSAPDLVAMQTPGEWTAFPALYFNPKPGVQSPFSNNQKLRWAAQHAVDRESMAKALGFGMAQPAYWPYWYPGMSGYDETLPKREFSLDKTKQYLSEAGSAAGAEIEVKVINRPTDVRPVELLQGMWANAGIKMKITALDRLPWVDDARAGKFEAAAHSNTARPDPYLAQDSRTGSTYNWPGYSNPEVDKLWEQAGAQYDAGLRAETYKKIQKVLYEDAYHIFGYMFPSYAAANKKVKNLTTWYNFRYIWLE
jgi:peptide/nickel transport system substrate-binding protein